MGIIRFDDIIQGMDLSESKVMDVCPDQKSHLLLKGIRAYVQQMQNGIFPPPTRMQLRLVRRPEVDQNSNILKDENMQGHTGDNKAMQPGMFPPPTRMQLRLIRRPEVDQNLNILKDEKLHTGDNKAEEKSLEVLKNSGSPKTEADKETIIKNCVCLRDISLVFCRYCGYNTKGRIQKKCSVHPNVIFLMDIKQCPKCKSYNPLEHPLPR